jgi:hypothetical protein
MSNAINQPTHRLIYAIAREIQADWKKVNYGAVPYLQAMHSLNTIRDRFGMEPATEVVNYFLANSQGWRGDKARAIKAELKAMVESTYRRQ